jgi:hypothetical protein
VIGSGSPAAASRWTVITTRWHLQGEQVLGDGQALSSGTFSCTAEPSAMRCTDSGSGHFFYMSPGSYQIG